MEIKELKSSDSIVLVINGGSSSLKLSLFNFSDSTPFLTKNISGNLSQLDKDECQRMVESFIKEAKVDPENILYTGHRVVHGGTKFTEATIINTIVKTEINNLSSLAPIHNPIALKLIDVTELLFQNSINIAVFDTAFFTNLEPLAYIYAVPKKWLDSYGIRRFGFHGINHQYCFNQCIKILNSEGYNLKLINCHLGSGCSLAAISQTKCIDTSMGFTPMEGLIMGRRSGNIDPGIIFYLLKEKKLTSTEIENSLNMNSGLLALCGTNNMQEIETNISKYNKDLELDKDLELGLSIFVRSISKGIASLAVSLNGFNCLSFSGGIGENSSLVRKLICQELSFLGVEIDQTKNQTNDDDSIINTSNSKQNILKIKSGEDIAIKNACLDIIIKKNLISKYS